MSSTLFKAVFAAAVTAGALLLPVTAAQAAVKHHHCDTDNGFGDGFFGDDQFLGGGFDNGLGFHDDFDDFGGMGGLGGGFHHRHHQDTPIVIVVNSHNNKKKHHHHKPDLSGDANAAGNGSSDGYHKPSAVSNGDNDGYHKKS